MLPKFPPDDRPHNYLFLWQPGNLMRRLPGTRQPAIFLSRQMAGGPEAQRLSGAAGWVVVGPAVSPPFRQPRGFGLGLGHLAWGWEPHSTTASQATTTTIRSPRLCLERDPTSQSRRHPPQNLRICYHRRNDTSRIVSTGHSPAPEQPEPIVASPAQPAATMETFKALFVKPDPQTQVRKCNALVRSNIRKLDRDIVAVKQVEAKTKNLIIQADRRGQRDPARAKQAQLEIRRFAGELVRTRRTSARLITSKAQLNSVQMQVNEAFAVRKIEGSIRASVGIMKDVNTLIRLPELAGTMQELSMELMKAGIIEEMVEDVLPSDPDMIMEDDEGEVDKVLGEILKDRKEPKLPTVPLTEPQKKVEEEDEEEEDAEAMMDQMRNRLEALRS
ncbi:hypothetical protein G7Z17_g13251 [Cylindrodendrum hubeiense]|uniref:Vacuolar protein-sorting-associated protein 24 n=1 Tax=Cylindrodendrum hubeiense TaxID=595255 RepID=A0A9P5GWS2_9HYPO|nr:hypothetical protein G7Z17_g13251 [Cylindrodendrum hubeiense]